MNSVTSAIEHIGLTRLANRVGFYPSAVQKWRDDGKLPKSELAGLTNYAKVIEELCADATDQRKRFTAEQLLADTREEWEASQSDKESKQRRNGKKRVA